MKNTWKVWARGNDAPLRMSVGVTKCQLAPAQMMALAGQFVVINDIKAKLQWIEKFMLMWLFFLFSLRVLKSNRLGHFMCTSTEAIIDNKCGLLVEYCVLI